MPTHHTGGNGIVVEVNGSRLVLFVQFTVSFFQIDPFLAFFIDLTIVALNHHMVKNCGIGYDWRRIQRVDY